MITFGKQIRLSWALALIASGMLGQNQNQPQDVKPAQAPAAPASATPADVDGEPKPPRFSFGVKVDLLPQRLFQTQYTTASTTNPILNSAYFGSSPGSRRWLGLTSEYRLTGNVSLAVDLFYHQAEFTQLTQIKSGLQDPNSSYDNRPLTSITQDTRAQYWDIPFVARYYGLYKSGRRGLGWMKQTYGLGGVTYRHVSNIRTGTSTSNPDGSTDYSEIPSKAQHTNLAGAVGGVGYNLFELRKFRWMIEGRYTRWSGNTFQGPAYRSQQNQSQLGFIFTY
jgi:hypothetical protein